MGNDLAKTAYIVQLANELYKWLPGSTPPYSKSYTFGDIAKEFGLVWKGGSKLPSIQDLLEQAEKRALLIKVVEKVIQEGLKYRSKGGEQVTVGEIETLNSIMNKLGYRLPSLEDKRFIDSLGVSSSSKVSVDRIKLSELATKYEQMKSNVDNQSRGYELQDLLVKIFELWKFKPRKPFRIVGEEIDGSFELDNEIYLLEARWRIKPSGSESLLTFYGKVLGKSEWSRGLFLSINGFTPEALEEIHKGKRINFIAMNGDELELVLYGKLDLSDLLRKKVRVSADEGKFFFDVKS